MIHAEIERCAGIDVGKQELAVCVMIGPLAEEPRVETREFGTTNGELEHLCKWLVQKGITHAVMESTGSYWKPIYNVLEGSLTVYLTNAQDVKNRKGHKTDRKDSWWLAHLLRHAMIRPSYIPPRAIRELRDMTRRRKKLLGMASGERNRVEKLLQDANVKLSSALSDVFGVSGQLMLEALLEGKATPEQMAQLAQRRAKAKIPEIIAALSGHRMNEHHRKMINYGLNHLRFLEEQILELDQDIAAKIEQSGYQKEWELLQTVPGIKQTSAASVLAEVGPDMSPFGKQQKLCSWAGVCPGNNRSAGKEKSSHPTRGNVWLRGTLTESAWAAAAKNGCFLKDKFWRMSAKKHKATALVAVAHTLLQLVYRVLDTKTPYQERGAAPMNEQKKERLIRHHVKRLGKLGVTVYSPRPEAKRKYPSQTQIARPKAQNP